MSRTSGNVQAQSSDFAKSVGNGLRKAAKAARGEARRHGTMLYGAVDGRVLTRSPWDGAIVGWVVFNPETRTYSGGLIEGSKATWRGCHIRDVKKNIRDTARRLYSRGPSSYRFVQLVPTDPSS